MKVLFAVNNENISESIVKKYQKQFKEIISYKNVYYFNAILKEIQKDKTYDRIVISEDLEQFTNTSYEQMDKFIFERLDSISDEASNIKGEDIPKPGVPEGFKVLVKELQSLGLDLRLYSDKGTEIELKEDIDDGVDFNVVNDSKPQEETVVDEKELTDGYMETDEEMEEDGESIFEDLTDESDDSLIGDDFLEDDIDDSYDDGNYED